MKLSIAQDLAISMARKDFHKEIVYLAKKHGVRQSSVEIDPVHPVGEICIFINGDWEGYIDSCFYTEMETGKDCSCPSHYGYFEEE